MPFMAAALAAAPLLGRIFGGASQGSANQRLQENQQQLQQSQLQNTDTLGRAQLQSNDALSRARLQQDFALQVGQLDLARRQFQQNEPGVQARQAAIGSLLQRLQPLAMSGLSDRVNARMPRMNSLIDALGPEARQAGGLLAQRGLSGLQSGGTQFDPLSAPSMPALNLPPAQVAALQQSGMLERILGWSGLIGSTVGALGDFGQGNNTSGNNLPIDPYGGG